MLSKEFLEAVQKIETTTELKEAWQAILDRNRQIQIIAEFQYNVGDKVSWFNKRTGRDTIGTVTRINQKSISLDCGKDGEWKVSATILKKVA